VTSTLSVTDMRGIYLRENATKDSESVLRVGLRVSYRGVYRDATDRPAPPASARNRRRAHPATFPAQAVRAPRGQGQLHSALP
jgi:phosphate-selective porin